MMNKIRTILYGILLVLFLGTIANAQVYTSEIEVKANANGMVGIGMTDPSYKLDVIGDIRLSGWMRSENDYGLYNNTDGTYLISDDSNYWNFRSDRGIRISNRSNTTKGYLYHDNANAFGLLDGDGNWGLRLERDSYTSFLINNSEKMRILTGGGVGIGTTTPNSLLHIRNGTGNTSFIIQTKQDGSGGHNAEIVFSHEYSTANNTSGSQSGRKAMIRATNSWGWGQGVRIGFFTSSSVSSYPVERMVVAYNGYVGIGYTSPSEALDVNGNIRTSGVYTGSDERLKKNIRQLKRSGDLKKLNTYQYELIEDREEKTHFGLLAQEIEEVYPDMVITDSAGFKAVAYQEFIPLLIEKAKEQEVLIYELQQINTKLIDRMVAIEEKMK